MQPAAHSLLTPGVPLDAGEESLQEEPPADLHRYHHLQWTRVLLSERWVISKHFLQGSLLSVAKLELSTEAFSKKTTTTTTNRRRFIRIDLWLLLCYDYVRSKKKKFV